MTVEQVSPKRQVRRAGTRRQIVHKVKVSADQEARLAAKAAERGVTVSRLLVESALAGGADAASAKAALAADLFSIMRVLGKIGVNINQLARVTNATLEVQPATVHALDAMARVSDRLNRMLDDLDQGERP